MTSDTPLSNQDMKNWINNKLSSLSERDILSLIEEINQTGTSDQRVQEITQEFTDCIGVLLLPVAQYHFYRARFWGHKNTSPSNLTELLEPPPEATKMGRCNIESNPVLYVSTHPRALIAECRFKSGDIYVLTQFDRTLKTEDLSCLLLGLDGLQKFEGDAGMLEMEKFRKDFFGEHYSLYKFIESQLHSQFVKAADSNNLTYNFTANLCQRFFSICPDLDAIVYPSIETSGIVNNLAIRPSKYSKTYTASKAGLFEVLSDGSSRQLMGATITSDGNLNWNRVTDIDGPKAVALKKIDPKDNRIYIAPWK